MCGRHADIGPIIPTVYSPDILELILAHATAARRDGPHACEAQRREASMGLSRIRTVPDRIRDLAR